MPERPLTVAYAAGAGLAAIALVYVFQPTFFIDGEAADTSASSRKRGVVGLSNPANDCFINSGLQALAGLGDLRMYLIRETHRRNLDGPDVYAHLVENPARRDMPAWKLEGLQLGIVTYGLKDILDALNERPLYQKTTSASGFVAVLEQAFRQRISRQQQDAQEFLQVVAERLCDEYHAGRRARDHASMRATYRSAANLALENSSERLSTQLDRGEREAFNETARDTDSPSEGSAEGPESQIIEERREQVAQDEEDGLPLQGGLAQQITCLTCKYQPKATETTFCMLSLSVPQVSSTTLDACFDNLLKTEHIEDFKCEKCRLIHAAEQLKGEIARSNSESFERITYEAVNKIQHAIETNPDQELKGVELPDTKFAPRRKIAKHVEVTKFPKILAIHLSRSIHLVGQQSTLKNSAKVAFQEHFRLGGLAKHRMYRLASVVCHKGSHHSGHYESFRRQQVHAPYSTPNTFQPASVYSKPSTPTPSQISTPQVTAFQGSIPEDSVDISTISSTPELLSPKSASTTSLPNGRLSGEHAVVNNSSSKSNGHTSAVRDSETSSLRSLARSAKSTLSKVRTSSSPITPTTLTATTTQTERTSMSDPVRRKRKKQNHRWWRISDDKVKECKTSDTLAMQKEVFLLFYEIETQADIS